MRFSREVQQLQRRNRVGTLRYLLDANLPGVLTAPVIYSMVVPLAITDAGLTLYQHICFRAYGVPRVRRRDCLINDRHKLGYLNVIEKLNCTYCGYANGMIAYAAGAMTVGLNIDLPHEQFPNPYISPELCFRFRYFALRKMHFLRRARALVAFPGGFGTMDELFETLTLIQTRTIRPVPVVLVGRSYWERLLDFDFLLEEGAIDAEDQDSFWFAEDAQEAWDGILDWHEENGEPLFPVAQ